MNFIAEMFVEPATGAGKSQFLTGKELRFDRYDRQIFAHRLMAVELSAAQNSSNSEKSRLCWMSEGFPFDRYLIVICPAPVNREG
jgi:hypothetical protein